METQIKKGKGKKLFAIMFVVIAIIAVTLGASILQTNETGHVQIKQAALSGTMSVRKAPGTYFQWFGSIQDYFYSGPVYLSAEHLDGGEGAESQAVTVLFPDGYCDVDFVGQYEVRASSEVWLQIRERYPSDKILKSMIRQQVIEVITNTASLMNAEEAYSSKRSEYIKLCQQQLIYGLFTPTYEIVYDTIQGGQVQETRIYSVLRDKDNKPVVAKLPLLGDYDIIFSQFNIKRLHNFDDKTVELINERKLAKAMQQKAITAKATGEANIATNKATQEAIKIEEVTIAEKVAAVAIIEAEKLFKVAEFGARAALEEKKKKISIAEGIAEELRIADGLSVLEKYRIDADVTARVGVAEHMSKWIGPKFVINGQGGNGNNGQSGIENTLMIKMMMDIINDDEKNSKNK